MIALVYIYANLVGVERRLMDRPIRAIHRWTGTVRRLYSFLFARWQLENNWMHNEL